MPTGKSRLFDNGAQSSPVTVLLDAWTKLFPSFEFLQIGICPSRTCISGGWNSLVLVLFFETMPGCWAEGHALFRVLASIERDHPARLSFALPRTRWHTTHRSLLRHPQVGGKLWNDAKDSPIYMFLDTWSELCFGGSKCTPSPLSRADKRGAAAADPVPIGIYMLRGGRRVYLCTKDGRNIGCNLPKGRHA